MFLSECPEFDPDPRYRDHNLWLVGVCVSDFCDLYGVDQANEYFAAGQAKLVEFLGDEGRLTKPIPYVRKAIKRAILRHWQIDRQLGIPPSTRRDMVNRGQVPPDQVSHSWHHVFDNNGLRSVFNEHEVFDPMNDPVDSEDLGLAELDNVPHCAESESQWMAPTSISKERSKITETVEVVYSLCRDDLDRQIVEARMGSFASIDDDPVHVDDVADQLGISSYEVGERLNRLERRYYKLLDRTTPTKRQTQRAVAR